MIFALEKPRLRDGAPFGAASECLIELVDDPTRPGRAPKSPVLTRQKLAACVEMGRG